MTGALVFMILCFVIMCDAPEDPPEDAQPSESGRQSSRYCVTVSKIQDESHPDLGKRCHGGRRWIFNADGVLLCTQCCANYTFDRDEKQCAPCGENYGSDKPSASLFNCYKLSGKRKALQRDNMTTKKAVAVSPSTGRKATPTPTPISTPSSVKTEPVKKTRATRIMTASNTATGTATTPATSMPTTSPEMTNPMTDNDSPVITFFSSHRDQITGALAICIAVILTLARYFACGRGSKLQKHRATKSSEGIHKIVEIAR